MKAEVSLKGIFDMHVHTAPDVIQRTYHDIELTDAAIRVGARAIVIKGHHCETMARAALCNIYVKEKYGVTSFTMYGGLVLNKEAGGLNPKAVETALKLGAKEIWLPTVDAQNEYQKRGKAGNGIRVIDEKGALKTELLEIFALVKDADAVLSTGHISPEEIFCVASGARKAGVKKLVITHPEYWIVDLSLEQQKQLIEDYDVILERCYRQPLADGHWISNTPKNLQAIRALGASHTLMSTDCGNPANPPWEEAMREYVQYMAEHGITDAEIQHMTRKLPAWLLGIGEKPEM